MPWHSSHLLCICIQIMEPRRQELVCRYTEMKLVGLGARFKKILMFFTPLLYWCARRLRRARMLTTPQFCLGCRRLADVSAWTTTPYHTLPGRMMCFTQSETRSCPMEAPTPWINDELASCPYLLSPSKLMATPRDSNSHLCSSNVLVCRQLLCGSVATEISKHGNVCCMQGLKMKRAALFCLCLLAVSHRKTFQMAFM